RASAPKSRTGTNSNRRLRAGGCGTVSAASVSFISTPRRKEACGTKEQDRGHENVDQHRSERPACLARDGGLEKEAQDVRREGPADRIHEPDEQGGQKRPADRADSADHDDDESKDEDVVAHARLDGKD